VNPRISLPALVGLGGGAVIGFLLSGRISPPVSHVIFVPSVLLLGLVLGFVLGGRAARDAQVAQERAAAAKAARRAARDKQQ
jgi:hypothetical protein